ncbi:MAG TPA: LysM peptidoglycan-binding domain-containing protein [Clostridiaceae bacterium]|nr:LysM peptidoglycan-binding domain-containing protein [Clostridiaceae bacterium]
MFLTNRKKASAFIIAILLFLTLSFPAYAGSYTVVKNDSLYLISQTFNTSVATIKNTNNLTSDIIYPGQKLKVPATDYTVKSGDTLYLIAKRAGISLWSLRKANNKWDDMIYVGQKLIIPEVNGGNTSSTNSSTQTGYTGNAVIPYSSYELDLLARLITAEAVSEPYLAQVAVGAVVVNRVKDPRFPNTITSVIYQKDSKFYQFTPVENGWINKPATDTARKAALEALNGHDPTKGAIYYFDDSATNKWLWSRPIALRSGKMVYTY